MTKSSAPEPEKKNLFGMLIVDLTNDREVLRAIGSNLDALRTHLRRISDIDTREKFRVFIEGTRGAIGVMVTQKDIVTGVLTKMEAKWLEQQTATCAGDVTEPKSTSDIPLTSSVAVVEGLGKNPPSPSETSPSQLQ